MDELALYAGDARPDGAERARRFIAEDLVGMRDRMLRPVEDRQASEVFLDALRELMAFGKIYFAGKSEKAGERKVEVVGRVDGEYYDLSLGPATGRLRAHTASGSSRNCIFQGAAADGVVLGLWPAWHAGHKIVDFVHDEVAVESPDDDRVAARAAELEGLMMRGLLSVVPGMIVEVETVVARSLNKADVDPRQLPGATREPPAAATPPRHSRVPDLGGRPRAAGDGLLVARGGDPRGQRRAGWGSAWAAGRQVSRRMGQDPGTRAYASTGRRGRSCSAPAPAGAAPARPAAMRATPTAGRAPRHPPHDRPNRHR